MVVSRHNAQGFTLVENVMAICMMGFLMVSFTSLLAPQAVQTADTLTQQRASQIASLLLQEMYTRPFDEQNLSQLQRCEANCTPATALQSEADDNGLRDDFDDYDTQDQWLDISQFALFLDGPYEGFEINIDVEYVDGNWGSSVTPTATKHAQILTRRGENGEVIEFHAYRSNF
ncbi:pili assembly chaperone [Vibrio aquaticus]|uniref:Pili assembly chaperone n=1 Tax=Vibrio aquaticus TaxID=2496559 RepID=A0A3S0PP85_9VIBR|nr:pili assembly chaperone [Vibrio aquaticus]RTZ16511.1 pili assembly chaperone [Vibrio aquaticus]